ncbi:MAG: hypothetical protein GY747_03810 [Planctomycetes bacterium]|nr:hypothetical protein [Planctomycetota bacterium]MCP4861649.1 hypothetical protein [Planctomycetota bacterium]
MAPGTPEAVRAFTSFGSGIGQAGFVPSTAPGLNEIYMDGDFFGNFWQAQRFEPGTGQFVQTFASSNYNVDVLRLFVADVHPTPGDELIVVMSSGYIYLHHQVTKEEIEVIITGAHYLDACDMADMNGDGRQEFAMLGDYGLQIFNSHGLLTSHYPTIEGDDLVIGNMDADAGMEIAPGDGTVLDFDSGTIQCSRGNGFGSEMALSDIDNDGMDELIYAEQYYTIRAFDVDTCLPKWSMSVPQVDAMTIADSNQAGVDELIIGEGQFGDISA